MAELTFVLVGLVVLSVCVVLGLALRAALEAVGRLAAEMQAGAKETRLHERQLHDRLMALGDSHAAWFEHQRQMAAAVSRRPPAEAAEERPASRPFEPDAPLEIIAPSHGDIIA